MASGTDVGTAYITIMPNADRFGRELSRQTGGASASAGRSGGHAFGGAFAAVAGGIIAAAGIGAFLKNSLAEATDALKVGKLTAQVIKTTGGAAKITAKQVGDLSSAISAKVGVDDEAIQSSANLLLTFTDVRNEVGKGNDVFNQATQLTVDMGAALGQDAKAGAIQLGKALNDPIKGVSALSKVGVSFTEKQKEQIKALVGANNTLGAQKIILAELKKEFGGAAEAQVTDADKLSVAWGNFQETIGTALLPIISKVASALNGLIQIGSEWWTSFNDATLSPALKAIAPWFHDVLMPVLKEVAGWVQDHLVAAWNYLADAFTQYVVPAISAIYDALSDVWTRVQPIFKALGAAFTVVVNFVKDHLSVAFGHIRDIIVNHVGPAIKAWGKAWSDTVQWIIKTFRPAITWLLARLGDMIHFISSVVVPAIKWLFDFIKKNAGWMLPVLAGIGAAILAWKALAFIMALNPFTRILIIIIALGTFIQQHWEAIKAAFAKAWQQITTAIHVAWDAIYAFFKTIITAIVSAFNNSIDWLVSAGKNIFTGFMTGVHWVWNNILFPFFVGIPRAVINFFISALGWLVQAGKNVLQGLWNGLKWIWTNVIVGFFLDIPKKIGGWFTTAITWLVHAGFNILKGLLDGIGHAAVAVWEWFKALPGKIINFFIELPGKLYDIGMNVIRSMWGGMDDASSGKAKIFGEDLIAGIKDVLKIDSPSKVFMEIGQNLTAGLIRGLMKDNPVAIATKIFGGMPEAIKGLFGANKLSTEDIMGITNPKYKGLIGSILGGLGSGGLGGMFTGPAGPVSGDLSQWLHRAMAITGVPESWYAPLVSLVMHESGGNPRAINLWDRNAVAGTPSKGLLQTIDPTFNAYALPGMGDIWNPVDNAVAAIRYMIARYGSIFQIASYTPNGFVGGYEQGTNYVPRTGLALVHQGEAIIPKAYNQAAATGGSAGAGGLDFGRTVEAFREAMRGMRVELDGQAVGRVQAAYSTRLARR